MSEVDAVAELRATVFRAWALAATNAMKTAEAALRMVADWAYVENRELRLVGEADLSIEAPAGAQLSVGGDFLWLDEYDNVPVQPAPEERIAAALVSFKEATVPEPNVPGGASLVHIGLRADHPVRTGQFTGPVLADGVEVARPAVFVSGIDP